MLVETDPPHGTGRCNRAGAQRHSDSATEPSYEAIATHHCYLIQIQKLVATNHTKGRAGESVPMGYRRADRTCR